MCLEIQIFPGSQSGMTCLWHLDVSICQSRSLSGGSGPDQFPVNITYTEHYWASWYYITEIIGYLIPISAYVLRDIYLLLSWDLHTICRYPGIFASCCSRLHFTLHSRVASEKNSTVPSNSHMVCTMDVLPWCCFDFPMKKFVSVALFW